MNNHELTQAANLRRSRRKYLDQAIAPDVQEKLQAFADAYGAAGDMRIELVFNDGTAFAGFRKSYGLLTGVQHYAGLIAKRGCSIAEEKMGYFGELFMLQAVALGLGTCWVGGSFRRADCPFELADDEQLYCAITLGHCAPDDNARERFIQSMTHRRTKRAEDMMAAANNAPDWFVAGVQAVERAPSARNLQPWMFSYQDDMACVTLVNSRSWVDLGIAKLHFALGAGAGTWQWGDGGAFTRE
ncbi:MAG: nitroreductase [Oscillospiraceae bacterium]|nr:nitroreductase [Oscillospiraceae bacterium]